jgi:hypothetical protein
MPRVVRSESEHVDERQRRRHTERMSSPAATPPISGTNAWYVASGVLVLIAALLAWDHLIGNEGDSGDAFPVDLGAFVLSFALVLALALLVFGILVPRALHAEGSVARYALIMAAVAVVTAPFLTWLGLPQVLAGGGLVLGLAARATGHSRAGTVAAVLSLVVLVFGIAATAFPADSAAD